MVFIIGVLSGVLTNHNLKKGKMEKNLQLTFKDREIFLWLWMVRVTTIQQIRRTHYWQADTEKLSHVKNVETRLSRLQKAGYLNGTLIQNEETGKKQKIYLLAKPALRPLRIHYGIEQKELYDFRKSNAFEKIYHALWISECACRVVECLRGSDWELDTLQPIGVPFYHTYAIGNPRRRPPVERFVTQWDFRGPNGKNYGIRPDLVFALKKGSFSRLFFLEADRGFEGNAVISEKLEGYHYQEKHPHPEDGQKFLWRAYGNLSDYRVLFITTTDRRVENLTSSLKEVKGFHMTAFTTFKTTRSENMLFDPLWRVPDGSTRSLLKR